MQDFFNFREMITPAIIKLLFILGLIFCVLYAVIAVFSYPAPRNFIIAILSLTIGPILLRIYCEFIVVLFSIHESLEDIRKGAHGLTAPSPRE